jgi:hypothetical protein
LINIDQQLLSALLRPDAAAACCCRLDLLTHFPWLKAFLRKDIWPRALNEGCVRPCW